MLAVLRFVSFSEWKMQKKSLKTDHENLVHVYLSDMSTPQQGGGDPTK
jgi:hypothetical protein